MGGQNRGGHSSHDHRENDRWSNESVRGQGNRGNLQENREQGNNDFQQDDDGQGGNSWQQGGREDSSGSRYGSSSQGSSQSSGMRSSSSSRGQGYGQDQHGSGENDRSWSPGQDVSRGRQGGGQFAGKGPKGYQRSDERIREDVNEALSRHGDVDATEVEVEVKDGEVTLTGTVHSREAKRAAEEAVEELSGVRDVQNRIRVQATAMAGQSGKSKDGGNAPDNHEGMSSKKQGARN